MFFCRHGLKPPLVTSPTSLPAASRILECWRAGAPAGMMSPMRRLVAPSASCFCTTEPPKKSNFSRRRLPEEKRRISRATQ